MVSALEKGKYYRYKYTDCKVSFWCDEMCIMLDQKPRMCMSSNGFERAKFQDLRMIYKWDPENFELVDEKDIPHSDIKLLKFGEIYSLQTKLERFTLNKRKKGIILNKSEAKFIAGALQNCRYYAHLPDYDESDAVSNEDGV